MALQRIDTAISLTGVSSVLKQDHYRGVVRAKARGLVFAIAAWPGPKRAGGFVRSRSGPVQSARVGLSERALARATSLRQSLPGQAIPQS